MTELLKVKKRIAPEIMPEISQIVILTYSIT